MTLVFAFGVVVVVMRGIRQPATVDRIKQMFTDAASQPVAREGVREQMPSIRSDFPPDFSQREPRKPFEFSPAALASIRDNTYFRATEKEPWFELLGSLQNTPDGELAGKSIGQVGYVQLKEQPNTYRGKVVTVRGTVRQVTEERPAANDLGIDRYYRLVLQPSGGEIWPIFIYVLELPADFPRGERVEAEISATGYFFKNLSYPWADGLGTAPVIVARSVTPLVTGSAGQAPLAATRTPVASDTWHGSATTESAAQDDRTADLKEILALAGWDDARLQAFVNGESLSPAQRGELVQLLWRVRTFDTASITAWTRSDVMFAEVVADPDAYRGNFVRFSGRVRRVVPRPLPAAEAERLEMSRYFECELDVEGNAGLVSVLAGRVPPAWLQSKPLDEPATVAGLLVQRLPAAGTEPRLLLVAKEVVGESLGRTVLTTLGMDAGLLDGIRNHQPILAAEREAFYGMLAAVEQVGANQLIRSAERNLDSVAKEWKAELKSADSQRRLLAEEITRRADDGTYSVAPLFNDADRQVGQLMVVDGVARRIVRVDARSAGAGAIADDVARRLGVDHYYEMEVFTDDSQNRPLVFCVRDLPPGMAVGDDVREPVRVAGFFFKSWRYRTRDAGGSEGGGDGHALGKSLIAPLLVGRGPVRIELEQGRGYTAELVGGGLFIVAFVGIWAAAWWIARGDWRFRERTLAANFSLPPGESLDELNVPDVEQPMMITGSSTPDASNSSQLQ